MSRFEVVQGVEGCCLALDHTRIAGPKPWGGGTVIHAWVTDKEYKAVEMQSRWYEMFGTPERAARTLEMMCDMSPNCSFCPLGGRAESICGEGDYDKLLGWLRGDA